MDAAIEIGDGKRMFDDGVCEYFIRKRTCSARFVYFINLAFEGFVCLSN